MDQNDQPSDDRDSGMEISLSLSLGYRRKRPLTNDRFESRIDSFALIAIGLVVTALLLGFILPKILAAIGLF